MIQQSGILLAKKSEFNSAKGNAFTSVDEYLRNDHFFSENKLFQLELKKKKKKKKKITIQIKAQRKVNKGTYRTRSIQQWQLSWGKSYRSEF